MSKKNERFLNLLSALCICNGEAISSNQDDICDMLLEEEEYSNLLIRIKSEPNQQGMGRKHLALIEDSDYKMADGSILSLEVEKFKHYFEERNDLRLYNYFESMVHLVSLMCLQRNYKGINIIVKMYPIDFSIDCFLNPNIPEKLRANLAKILISVHIDKEPLEMLNLPILTRVWQEIAQAKTNLAQSKVPISLKLLKLKDFVVEFFTATQGIQRNFANDTNILTL